MGLSRVKEEGKGRLHVGILDGFVVLAVISVAIAAMVPVSIPIEGFVGEFDDGDDACAFGFVEMAELVVSFDQGAEDFTSDVVGHVNGRLGRGFEANVNAESLIGLAIVHRADAKLAGVQVDDVALIEGFVDVLGVDVDAVDGGGPVGPAEDVEQGDLDKPIVGPPQLPEHFLRSIPMVLECFASIEVGEVPAAIVNVVSHEGNGRPVGEEEFAVDLFGEQSRGVILKNAGW